MAKSRYPSKRTASSAWHGEGKGIGFERQKPVRPAQRSVVCWSAPAELVEWQNGSEAPRHNGRMNRLISYRKNGEQGCARFGVLPVRRTPDARYPDHGHIATSLV